MTVLPEYQQVEQLIAQGRLDDALTAVQNIVYSMHRDPLATAEVYSSPFLDAACQRIGASTLPLVEEVSPDPQDVQVYIASALHDTGGHSRVLLDYIRLQPQRRHVVILTNLFNEPADKVRQVRLVQTLMGSGVLVKLLMGSTPMQKLVALQRELRRWPAANVFLFNHHGDAVAISAVQPGLNKRYFYCHHADHNLALGCHLDGVAHVDLHGYGYHTCRDVLGIDDAQYWPLSIPDQGPRSAFGYMAGPLVTAACGSPNKFDGPYWIDYFEIISLLLTQTGGQHIHIGPLSPAALERMRSYFEKAGCPVERFIHIPQVENLWAFLKASQVDVFFSSFPQGGGRSCIEAMGCGVPLIYHQHAVSPSLGGAALAPATCPSWRDWRDLSRIVASLTPAKLDSLGQSNRAHFEANYAPEVLSRILEDMHSDLVPENRTRRVPDSYLRHRLRTSLMPKST